MYNIDNIFREVEPLLNFIGLKIPEIPITFLDEQDWENFLCKRNIKEAEGAFVPKDCHVYLQRDNFSLPVFVHEYFGHGLFMRNSDMGKKIISLEEELERTNDANVKEKLNQLFNKNIMIYESFAVWMEDFLLRDNKYELLNKRLEKISRDNPEVYENYLKLKKFEKEKGPMSLLLKLGFSRDLDNSLILKISEENLREEMDKIKLIILYGSKEKRGDIDLLAVYDDNCNNLEKHHFLGEVDITRITEKELIHRLGLFDIEVTEPILNGEIIKGNEEQFFSLRNIIEKSEINDKTLFYNMIKSAEMYNHGLYFLNKARFERNESLICTLSGLDIIKGSISDRNDFESVDLLYSLVDFSYGFSYLSTLNRLKEGQKIIRLSNILSNPINEQEFMLRRTLDYVKGVKSEDVKLSYFKTKNISNYLYNLLMEL